MNDSPRRLSTPRKLMLALIGILFAVMCVSNGLLVLSTGQLNRETIHSLEIQYDNTLSSLTSNMDTIRALLQNLLDDQDLNRLTRIPGLLDADARLTAIGRLQSKLSLIKSSNPLIYNASIFIPRQRISLNADSYPGGIFERHSAASVEALDEQARGWSRPLEAGDGRLLMPLVSRRTDNGALNYTISVQLSAPAIQRLIRSSASLGDVHYLFDVNSGTYQLSSATGEGMARQMRTAADAPGSTEVRLDGTEYLLLSLNDEAYGIRWVTMISSTALLSPIRWLSIAAYALIALVLLSAGLYVYMDAKWVDKPLRSLIGAFREVEQGHLDARLDEGVGSEFGYLFSRFNGMTARIQSLIDKTYKQQLLLRQSELKQLQQQMNPHFLYNSYFLLHRLVKKRDMDRAELLSHQLGQYLKYITRGERDFVTLGEENEQARIYADIQAMRFTGRIRVLYPPPPAHVLHIAVPRLILQPLIENSFLHGLDNKAEDGMLKVLFQLERRDLVISVEDNGNELTDEALRALAQDLRDPAPGAEITGLLNIRRRLELVYDGGKERLSVMRSGLGGLRTELRLPLSEEVDGDDEPAVGG